MAAIAWLLLCLSLGTVPGMLVGIGQLFWRPRWYGLVSMAVSALPFAAFQLTNWVLLDLRGVTWGD